MNKKQLIVGWMMIFSIALVIARTIMTLAYDPFKNILQFYSFFLYIIIIGGALIFLLRDRKR